RSWPSRARIDPGHPHDSTSNRKTNPMRSMIGIPLALALLAPSRADDPPPGGPSPVPVNRTELKLALEGSKHSRPRLPLPPVTAEERQAEETRKAGKAEWGIVNNGRMRRYYLPAEVR